jgi:hypothetical protein
VVFLDIDGVLNHRAWFERATDESIVSGRRRERQLDPASIGLLNQLIVRTRSEVVISSTWRVHYPPDELERILKLRGFIGKVIGATPDLQRGGSTARRGNDIGAWLDMTRRHGLEIDRLVILDDDRDMGVLLPFLVKVSNEVGLTQLNIDSAVRVLFEMTLTEHAQLK